MSFNHNDFANSLSFKTIAPILMKLSSQVKHNIKNCWLVSLASFGLSWGPKKLGFFFFFKKIFLSYIFVREHSTLEFKLRRWEYASCKSSINTKCMQAVVLQACFWVRSEFCSSHRTTSHFTSKLIHGCHLCSSYQSCISA